MLGFGTAVSHLPSQGVNLDRMLKIFALKIVHVNIQPNSFPGECITVNRSLFSKSQ